MASGSQSHSPLASRPAYAGHTRFSRLIQIRRWTSRAYPVPIWNCPVPPSSRPRVGQSDEGIARVSHLSQPADCCEPYRSILVAKNSCERGLEIYGTVAAVIDGTIDSRHWWDTVTEVCRRIGAAAAPAVFVIAAMTLVITEVVEYIMMLSEKMYEDL